MVTEEYIKRTLRILGVSTTVCGYSYIAYGVSLALEDGSCLGYITKGLYVDIARKFETSAGCVERDIRTAAEAIWRNGDRKLLAAICGGTPPAKRPANSKLFEMLRGYFANIGDTETATEPNFWCDRLGDECQRLKALLEETMKLRDENQKLKDMMGIRE